MSEPEPLFKGVVVIDLEAGKGWDKLKLPLHVPILHNFTMTTDGVDDVRRSLIDSMHELEPFTAKLDHPEQLMGGSKIWIRRLTSAALMNLHLEVFKAVRPHTVKKLDLGLVGDNYIPQIESESRDSFTGDSLRVDHVSFAMGMIRHSFQQVIWTESHTLELGVPDDQNAS